MAAHKGQNIDFIVATCEDDTGALSRVSAISSAFPHARVIVADSSGVAYKRQSRLLDTLQLLKHQAVYVDCETGCRYSCYQQALQHATREYVAFRYDNGKVDEALTALGFNQGFEEDALVTHPAWPIQGKTQHVPAKEIEAVLFKRQYLEQHQLLGKASAFDNELFLTRLADSARVKTQSAAA